MYGIALAVLILLIIVRILNINRVPEQSLFYSSNAKFLEQILKNAPKLTEPYNPTRLWGYSGHVQTIIGGVISLFRSPLLNGKRFAFRTSDGATVTYDLYQPLDKHQNDDDITLTLAPGICNSSESVYIRRVVYHAQFQGYRVAVLNHVGALKGVPVTSPRIFNYGNTTDYDGMVRQVVARYPTTKIICIGFSMGGNIVTKYLGERKSIPQIIAGISACQGYDAYDCSQLLLQWENFRRLYFFAMTENMRAILRRWQKQLFPEELKQSKDINEKAVWAAATLQDLDNAYTKKLYGYKTIHEMYRKWSCYNYWENITVPIVFINATDDPIVPPKLVEKARSFVLQEHTSKTKEANEDSFVLKDRMLIEQKYGGHLGFHEGGFLNPNTLTWLDRTVVNLANSLSTYVQSEGRRPDLKVIDEIAKMPNPDVDAAVEQGSDIEENMKSRVVPNIQLTQMKTSIQQNSFILNQNDTKDSEDMKYDSDSNASSSDSSDLDDIFQPNQHTRMRPAFNCKKKMISPTSY